MSFSSRGLEGKSMKSRDTWNNRQAWPWSTKWSRRKAVLSSEHTGQSHHPLPITQETLHMDITRWSTLKSDWLYSLQPKMEKLYTVSKNKTGSWLWLTSWTHYQIQTEIEESRRNHKAIRVWPKSNPSWLYSGSDRLKRLDLIDRVLEQLWIEVCNIVQEVVIHTILKKKK